LWWLGAFAPAWAGNASLRRDFLFDFPTGKTDDPAMNLRDLEGANEIWIEANMAITHMLHVWYIYLHLDDF